MNKIFRDVEKRLEQENTAKFRGVYFLELHHVHLGDFLEKQEEIIQNIKKSISRNKPVGFVRKIRKSHHRRNVFITHDFSHSLFDTLSSEKIIELIHKKNEKYPYYDKNVDECWLIIVSDMNSLASRFSIIQDKEDLQEIESPFHKIFHLENLCGNLTSIKG